MSHDSINHDIAANLRRGDTVVVRSLSEILATLDADSRLEGLPFMPEMVPCCGQTFRVYRRADKTCVEGVGIRGMSNTVFLEGLRCDGSLHDDCQRGCLFFWKEAWLASVKDSPLPKGEGTSISGSPLPLGEGQGVRAITDMETHSSQLSPHPNPLPKGEGTVISDSPGAAELPTTKDDRFYCQSTELAGATRELPPGKWGHYLHDLRMGEISPRRFAYMLWMALTNRAWRLLRGRGFHQITGEQKKTLSVELNLQPGEWIEIKSPAEIQATLDAQSRNRGLTFEPEMALHCGRRCRVATPVRKIILEETGKMAQLNNTVILDGLVCEGICSKNCPRANYLYWREIWLKRV